MLDPHLDTVSVYVPAAADLAKCQIFGLLHLLVTHAAHLLRVELHSWHMLFFVTVRFFRLFFGRLPVVSPVRKSQLYNL